MKAFRLTIYAFLTLCLCCVAVIFSLSGDMPDEAAVAAATTTTNVTFNETTYKTAGASVRLFEKDGSGIEDGLEGIRFHVLMNAELYETYKDDPNFKTYTAIIPTRLLSGELTPATANVMLLETTGVWKVYNRDTTYRESVAYVYNLPLSQHATDLSFRGFVSFDGGATIAQQTETAIRSMAFVAKSARDDSNAVLNDATREERRVEKLNDYIPQYQIFYKVGDTITVEDTEYGNVPAEAPSGITIWRDNNGELADLKKALTINNTSGNEKQGLMFTAYATITVNSSNASASLNGTGIANGTTIEVPCGTHTITVSPSGDYYISNVEIGGSDKGAIDDYTLSVEGDLSIFVETTIIKYSVSLDNAAGASVSGTVAGTYEINSTCSFTLGKGFYDVTVNGTKLSPSASRGYSFTVTANSVVKIVKMEDGKTKKMIMDLIANTPGSNLYVSGDNLVSPQDTSTITIPQAVFTELKKYGYTTISFDIYKEQPKEILYKKRIQNITDGTTVAECGINKASISGSVSLTKETSLQGQYKSFGTWGVESIDVNWTLSNIQLG